MSGIILLTRRRGDAEKVLNSSLRGAKRRGNPVAHSGTGLLRFARNDGKFSASPRLRVNLNKALV